MSGSNYHVNLRNIALAIYDDAHRRVARARGTEGDLFDALSVAIAFAAREAFVAHRDGIVTVDDLERLTTDFRLTIGKSLKHYAPDVCAPELIAAVDELDATVKRERGLTGPQQ